MQPMKRVGMVSAYFQEGSHHKCMKNATTNMALQTEMLIITLQPSIRFSIMSELATQKERPVRITRNPKTTRKTLRWLEAFDWLGVSVCIRSHE